MDSSAVDYRKGDDGLRLWGLLSIHLLIERHGPDFLHMFSTSTSKQLVTAGVRVFFYLEDRERTLDSPTDKIMLSLTAFADELEQRLDDWRTLLRDETKGGAKAIEATDRGTTLDDAPSRGAILRFPRPRNAAPGNCWSRTHRAWRPHAVVTRVETRILRESRVMNVVNWPNMSQAGT